WAITAAADRTLTLWTAPSVDGVPRLYCSRFDRFGTPFAGNTTAISGTTYGNVASDGRDFVVAATARGASQLFAVNGVSGTVRVLPFIANGYVVNIAWDGTGYVLVIPVNNGASTLVRVTPDGRMLWERKIVMFASAIAALPGRTLVWGKN